MTSESFKQDERRAIRELAYRLWETRGRPQGSAEQDWLEAERQVLNAPTVTHAVDPPVGHAVDPPVSHAVDPAVKRRQNARRRQRNL